MSRGRLKIAVVTRHFPIPEEPYRGRSIYDTVSQLSRVADIQILCPVAKYPDVSWLHPKTYRYYPPPELACTDNLNTTFFGYPVLPLVSRPLNGRVCRHHLLPLLRKAKPQLVLAYWIYPEGFAAVTAARQLGIPSVVVGLGSDLRRLKGIVRRRLTTRTLKQASRVITVSEELRQWAVRWGADSGRTQPVLNGCDFSIFRPQDQAKSRAELGIPSDNELVLFVGHLSPRKGIRELLAGFEMIARKRASLCLAMVGEGALQAEICSYLRWAGLSSRVLLLGRCNPNQVVQWLNAADVFCLPSHSEGCPSAIIEALACGRPVVATNLGGIPELINDHNGFLVSPRNVHALAEALEHALQKHWSALEIAGQFRRTWNDVANETLAICESALYGFPAVTDTARNAK